jgi:ankyrin repeat protein
MEILQYIENLDLENFNNWLLSGGNPNLITNEAPLTYLIQDILYELDTENSNEVLYKMLSNLLEKGAAVNLNGISAVDQPIFLTITEEASKFSAILLEHGANIALRDSEGYTLLLKTIENDDIDSLKLLLEYLPSKDLINEIGGHWNLPPLGLAFQKANVKMIMLLLEYGADPTLIDNDKRPIIEQIPNNIDDALAQQIHNLIDKS